MDLLCKAKIAYFLDIPSGLGGAGNLLIEQARLMSTLYNVLVVIPLDSCGNTNEEYAKRCKHYNLPFRCIHFSTSFNFSNIDFCDAMESIAYIEQFVLEEKVTFFHSVQLNIAVEYVSRKLHIPHVMDIYQIRQEEFECCSGDFYAHYHLCDSQIYKDIWSSQLGINSTCVRPVALLNSIQRKNKYPYEKIKILMLGNICERKNQLAAIKACEMCIKDGLEIELTIAGSLNGNYSEKCKKYIEQYNLEKNIRLIGFISDVIPLLESHDCLLCTSTDESFPSSIVEALTYDLTIISTPVAGVPEVFQNKYNSFISDDYQIESIYNSLVECKKKYQDGSILQIHKNAENTWLNNFSRKIVREQINDFYQMVIKRSTLSNHDFIHVMKEVNITTDELLEIYEESAEMKRRALYHTKLRKQLKDKKIYLWGAGKRGGYAYKILCKICPELKIVAFVDKYKQGFYLGLPIIKLDEMPIDIELMYGITFVEEREESINFLEKQGLQLYKQIWIIP